jgi:hypothetical protein
MAEVGHHLLDDFFRAVELAEGRIDLDDLVGKDARQPRVVARVDQRRFADGGQHALGSAGIGQPVFLQSSRYSFMDISSSWCVRSVRRSCQKWSCECPLMMKPACHESPATCPGSAYSFRSYFSSGQLLWVARIARADELALWPDGGLCVGRNASYVCEIDYCAIGAGSQKICRNIVNSFSSK